MKDCRWLSELCISHLLPDNLLMVPSQHMCGGIMVLFLCTGQQVVNLPLEIGQLIFNEGSGLLPSRLETD